MKITHLIAAVSMVAGLGVATAADAQYRGDRYDRHERRYDHRDDRRHHAYRGYDRGRYYGGRHGRRCHVEYRHHRRVTVCYR